MESSPDSTSTKEVYPFDDLIRGIAAIILTTFDHDVEKLGPHTGSVHKNGHGSKLSTVVYVSKEILEMNSLDYTAAQMNNTGSPFFSVFEIFHQMAEN